MSNKSQLTIKTQPNGSVKVQWFDRQKGSIAAEQYQTAIYTFFILFAGLFIFLLATGGIPLMIIIVPVTYGIIKLLLALNYDKPNDVIFTKTYVSHADVKYPVAEITRFEYGPRSQLTGEKPKKLDKNSEADPLDPVLIRLWINDAVAHEIGKNTWPYQESHAIRDALAKALDQVRVTEKEVQTTETFGETGDFGMPDY